MATGISRCAWLIFSMFRGCCWRTVICVCIFFMESYMLLSVLRDVLLLLLLLLLLLFSFHYFWWNRVSLCYIHRVFLNCWSSRVGIPPLPQVYEVLGTTESAAPCTCSLLSYTSGLRSSFSVLLLGLEMTGFLRQRWPARKPTPALKFLVLGYLFGAFSKAPMLKLLGNCPPHRL